MSVKDWIAQGLGIVGMILVFLSFQQKKRVRILLLQTCSSFIFFIHFTLLGAYIGGILNLIASVRALIFSQRDKKWAAHPFWVWFFILLCAGVYAVTTLTQDSLTLGHALLELLPVLGMAATTFSFRMKSAALVRRFSIISSPLWLVYNIASGSVGGTITESVSLISILIGILRLDRKKKTETQNEGGPQ